MRKSGRTAFVAIFLAGFLLLQFSLIRSTRKTLADYREPVPGWSTHSLITDTGVSAAVDGDLSTFWADTGALQPDRRVPQRPEPYEGLYIMVSPGMTHLPGNRPVPDPITGIELFTGDDRGKGRPARIRISYFEQQLYHINHDYRFPDPPAFVFSRDVSLQPTSAGQKIPLSFPEIPPSTGFPDNVKQRWLRLEILELYGGGNRGAIREIRFLREGKAP